MAIFNMSVSNIKRTEHTNLMKAYAYISGEAVKNEINEEVYQYRHAERVKEHGTILAPTMPEKWADGASLMHELEMYEKSKIARLGKRVRLACAYELSDEENIKAAKKYIDNTYTKNGYAVSWAYHVASDKQVEKRRKEIEAARRKVAPELPESEIKLTEEEIKKLRNPHIHILVLDRQFLDGKWQAKEHSAYKYIQQKDKNGNLLYDDKGNAIYEINPKTGKLQRDFYIDKKTGEPKRDKNGRIVYKKSVVVDNLISREDFFKNNMRGNWAKELNNALARNDVDVEVTEKSNIDAAIDKAIANGEDPEIAAAFAAIPQEKEAYREDKLIENAMIWKINKTQEKVKSLFQKCLDTIAGKIESIKKSMFDFVTNSNAAPSPIAPAASAQKKADTEGVTPDATAPQPAPTPQYDPELWHRIAQFTRDYDDIKNATFGEHPDGDKPIRSKTKPAPGKYWHNAGRGREYRDYYISDKEYKSNFLPWLERHKKWQAKQAELEAKAEEERRRQLREQAAKELAEERQRQRQLEIEAEQRRASAAKQPAKSKDDDYGRG